MSADEEPVVGLLPLRAWAEDVPDVARAGLAARVGRCSASPSAAAQSG